ncbi:MAG: glycine betaine/L-proline ABC transporter ATP-binding protein [bacterium]|nr:glycine betaine/L-proline ABC transporter ATP-binding protein [bacterium]
MDTASETVQVRVEGVWKVFGRKPREAREMAEAGATREKIQTATGSVVAVRDVSFHVGAGETFVVMGLSGSGKSTLIRCVSHLVAPTEGTVELCGTELTQADSAKLRELRRQKMAMVFQHFGLFPHRKVVDNVAYGLEVQGVDRQNRQDRARELLDTVGLDGWGDHYPQQLSGGMQQRVGLARALAVDPEVLFFDEPFSALDPLIRRDMQDELIDLQMKLQRTLVFITHDFAEALKLADRIAIMNDGAFVQVGTPVEILTSPADDYVRAFTQDAPVAKVLQACSLMRPLDGAAIEPDWHRVSSTTPLEVALPHLLGSINPVVVCDEQNTPVGLLHGDDVAGVISENQQ